MRTVNLYGKEVTYILKKSKRKSISASVDKEGNLEVRAPLWVKDSFVSEFLESNIDKIVQMLERSRLRREYEKNLGDDGFDELMEKARSIIPERVRYYSEIMGVRPKKVKIGKARTRFGSCSSEGNLNFSCRVMAYSANAVDYVVVHELAHLIHMDHSAAFWSTVEKYKPDYRKAREELKHIPE